MMAAFKNKQSKPISQNILEQLWQSASLRRALLTLCQVALITAPLAWSGCSGQQQDDEELEVQDDDYAGNSEGDLGQDDAAEGNGQENFVEDDDEANYANDDQGYNNNSQGYDDEGYNDQADVNSNIADDDLEDAMVEDVATNTVNGSLNNTGGGANYAAGGDNMGNMAGNPAVAAPTNYGAEPAPAAAAMPSDRAPIPGGRVRYVPEGGVEVLNAPDGSPILTLDQGEHPLTWEENGWLKLTQGMYVPMGSLSDQGVGRANYGVSWGGGSSGGGGYGGY